MAFTEGLTNRTSGYRYIHRKWPKVSRKATWWLMLLELIGLIPCLTIFGISQPDLYRTDLWKIGFENKLNSNPNMIVYAHANYKPVPPVPLVWSQALTDLNVAISVVSLFVLLVKLIAFIMKVWFPLISVVFNLALAALYATSTYGQIGPDYADERYQTPAAWYLRYGCDMAKPWGAYKSCQIAQSSLGITFYMLAIYVLNLGFSLYAMWPNPINKPKDVDQYDDDDDDYATTTDPKNWEMQSMKSPVTVQAMPHTPRTQAFHTLDRRMPQQSTRFA